MKLAIEHRHYNIVMNILAKYPFKFYAFGSRVKGNARPLSDLDLCVDGNIPGNVLTHIDEDFEESDLPFKVDILQLNSLSEAFYTSIKNDLMLLKN